MIDRGEAPSPALSVDFIVWTHKNFCERLPEELLVAEHPTTNRFAEGYSSKHLSRLRKIIGVAASHHRLAWIHPFLDGNGRVTRLFSHALLRELDVGSELWAVSRGLARRVSDFKADLQAADELRRGDLDEHGMTCP
ncbi:MAG: Fic family protein [Pseudomonadota bacterium]